MNPRQLTRPTTFLVGLTLLIFAAEAVIMTAFDLLALRGWWVSLLDSALLTVLVFLFVFPFYRKVVAKEKAAQRRAECLQYAIDQHAIMSIADPQGQIVHANDRFFEATGYSPAEVLGQNHRILKSDHHPPAFFENMWATLLRGEIWRGDLCNRRKDGTLYWVNATIVPFFDKDGQPEAYIAIRTDISRQKALQAAAMSQEIYLKTILDNLGEGVYTLDADGKMDYINTEGARMLGWSPDELLGKSLHPIIHHHRPDGRPLPAEDCPIHAAMCEGKVYRSNEQVFFTRAGDAFPVKLTGAPLIKEGQVMGSVAVFSDARQDRLLQQGLIAARDAAQAAARTKASFLSTVSHEIRTPLNGIVGMTGLLADTPLNSEQREFLSTIELSADALLSLINDILDYSRLEAQKTVPEQIPFSLEEVFDQSLDIVAARAQEKGLLLASYLDTAIPAQLLGDPARIRQILLNFLSNAVKFTSEGQVIARAVTESKTSQLVVIRLEVEDTGIGLSPAAQERLFVPFEQEDSSTTRKFGGTGLGLAISKGLAELMGGEVGVRGAVGQGSTFWAKIQLKLGEAVSDVPAFGAGKNVVIATQHAAQRALWERYFSDWQINTKWITRAEQLGTIFDHPDAVLLGESALKFGDWSAAARRLRIPCLVQAHTRLGLKISCDGVIAPPVKQSSLRTALQRLWAPDDAPLLTTTSPRTRPLKPHCPILVAEDNPVNQRVIIRLLAKLGYPADLVENGVEAVAAVQTGQYCLVLMDCQMPELDGFGATIALRQTEAGRTIPVVALTADAMETTRERCRAAGMNDYLSKPVNLEQLDAALARYLNPTIEIGPTPEPPERASAVQ